MAAFLWLGSAWAQDPENEIDPEALLLDTELAIQALEDSEDAVELGILETEIERPEPHVPTPERDVRFVVDPVDVAPGPPFGASLERALARSGDTSSLARDVARARFLPRLTLRGRRELRRVAMLDGEARESRWWVELQLCFGACGTTLTVDEIEGDFTPDLMVTAGEVVELDDRGAYASAATRVLEDAAESRFALANRLAAIYAHRALLRAQRAPTAVDEVRRALALAETDAQLDLYTDGWFTTGAP